MRGSIALIKSVKFLDPSMLNLNREKWKAGLERG
jgi:hypothetical protein